MIRGWSSDEQIDEALSLVDHHLRKIPFISDALDHARIERGCLSLANTDRIAPSTKQMLRETPWQDRMSGHGTAEMLLQSSGTTGAPTIYAWSQSDLDHIGRVTGGFRSGLGCGPGDTGAVWAPADTSVMGRCMIAEFEQMGCAYQALGPIPPPDALAMIIESQVTVLKGLPSAAAALATMGSRSLSLRQVHVGGDILLNTTRHRIESLLGCDCYNFFGLSEVYGPIAAECRAKSGMHYVTDDVLLEVLDPSTAAPVVPGSIGLGVFTTLWNKTSPTLRYWSNDLVQVHTQPCACGDHAPRITHHGRYFGYDYEGRTLLSQLLIADMFDRHADGLRNYHVQLTDSEVTATVSAAGDVRTRDLLSELESHMRARVRIEAAGTAAARPKPGSFDDLRGSVHA